MTQRKVEMKDFEDFEAKVIACSGYTCNNNYKVLEIVINPYSNKTVYVVREYGKENITANTFEEAIELYNNI
jgi:hypothetical protein